MIKLQHTFVVIISALLQKFKGYIMILNINDTILMILKYVLGQQKDRSRNRRKIEVEER